LFFNIFAERGLEIADLSITILVFFYTAISLSILYVLTRGIDVGRRNPIILTAIFPNAIFLGFPMVMAICGNIVYASLYGLVMLVLNIAVGGLMGLSRSQVLQSVMRIPK